MKIKVMLDSSADIPKELEVKENLTVARFTITVDGKEYIDEEELSLDKYKTFLNEGRDMSTSQASIGLLMQMWDEALKTHDEIIYITLSKSLSGSYSSAYALSQEYNGRVTVLDTDAVAYPLYVIYEAVVNFVNEGKSIAEIKEIVESNEKMYAHIVPFDINHLKKGGRISSQAAALANLLKINPILSLDNGVIDAHDKVRTRKKAVLKAAEQLVEKYPNSDDYVWYLLHSDLEDEAEHYAEWFKEKGINIVVKQLYPLILTHTGPQTIAFGVYKKLK